MNDDGQAVNLLSASCDVFFYTFSWAFYLLKSLSHVNPLLMSNGRARAAGPMKEAMWSDNVP